MWGTQTWHTKLGVASIFEAETIRIVLRMSRVDQKASIGALDDHRPGFARSGEHDGVPCADCCAHVFGCESRVTALWTEKLRRELAQDRMLDSADFERVHA